MYLNLYDFQYEIDRFKCKSYTTRKRFILVHLMKCYKYERENNINFGHLSELEALVEIRDKLKEIISLHTFSESHLKRNFYSRHSHSELLTKSQFKEYIAKKYANQIPYLLNELALTEQDLNEFISDFEQFTRDKISSLISKLEGLYDRI